MKKYIAVEIVSEKHISGPKDKGLYYNPETGQMGTVFEDDGSPLNWTGVYFSDLLLDEVPAAEMAPGSVEIVQADEPRLAGISEETHLKALAIAQSPELAVKLLKD